MPAKPFVAAAAVTAAVSIQAGQGSPGQRAPVFTTRTQGVLVDVPVTERNRPVAGIKAADFELRDNGVAQTIDSAEIPDAPLNALLALDVSGAYGAYLVFVLVATGVIYFVGKRLKMPRGERLDRGGFHFKR